jgi:hypothetical protein
MPLPSWVEPSTGYLRTDGSRGRVVFEPSGAGKLRRTSTWQPCRILFHDLQGASADVQALTTGPLGSKLAVQLQQAVAQLRDEELDESFQPMQQQLQQQHADSPSDDLLTWRSNVRLHEVNSTAPGSRAYKEPKDAVRGLLLPSISVAGSAAQRRQMLAVVHQKLQAGRVDWLLLGELQ